MRVFVTGASGYLGTAVVADLVAAGHDVVGLVRSGPGEERLLAAGGRPLAGDLRDADALAAGSRDADAVVHLGWAQPGPGVDPVAVDRAAIEAIGAALAGTGRPFAVASGVLGLDPGRVVTEETRPTDRTSPVIAGRAANGEAALALAGRDVAPVLVRLAPSVHDDGRIKPGFAGRLAQIAREAGSAGYPGDGSARWSAVHRLDAARLFRLAVEGTAAGSLPPGAVLDGVAEEGVSQRAIAEVIGASLGVPTASLDAAAAAARFGWLAPLVALDAPATSAATRSATGWSPAGPGLLEDLRDGAASR